ncbi:MAG: ABC transporter permease [Pigmentiphaga sp.]|uniref:ABC transporter permease n=1 Tax=Pigmentiphaga sp. TaxID=1977564 RepID=UPI0029A3E6F0|nr:ABC transporter permease [Pigmentiphaga sp.]MDX3905745.1 ABC transporter permease [Pigmentiphaga sp.]
MMNARNANEAVMAATSRPRPVRRRAWSSSCYTAATVAALLLAWEAACRIFDIGAYLLPTPTEVIKTIADDPVFLLGHTGATAAATIAGFVLAVIVGVALAVAIVYSRLLEKTLFTSLVAFNAIPKVAIAPLFIMWVGTGIESKVLMAFLIAIFPIIVDTVAGLRSVDPAQLDLARTYRSSHFKMFWKIRFPNALPGIFAGMKVGITLALIGTIVGEFVGSNRGLGFVVLQAQGTYQTPLVFAAISVLSVLGVVLFHLIDLAERRLLPWHVSHRGAKP